MEPERWQQIKEVLIGLSQREESDRHVFLEQACAGDENLRDEVESLLAYEKESEDLIELPPRRMVADLLTQYESDSGPVVKPDSSDEVMIGKTVARYRILEQLGAGGMGTVYKAEDTELGRFVALKFLSGSAIESNPTNLSPDKSRYSTQAIERFRREARAASALDHPNICIVHDVDQHEGVPFIVMQFLSGQNLKQEIDGKALPTDRILDLAIQIANALDAAHKAGIVHRDIKSANILVTELGEAKVLDFGLAKLGALPLTACETVESLRKVPTQVSGDTMSRPGTALGTVAYMSPEQVRGEQVDARSDLFSLGVILYEMATGKVPFTGETVSAVFENILHGNSMSPSVLNPAVPRELDRIVRKAMEKSVELRYQSAGELRDDLKRLQTDSAEHAIHSSTIRNRWPLTLAVATVLLVAALLVGYLHFRAQPGAALTERDTLVLADFNNTTGETIFDETLKQALRAQLEQSPFLNVLSDHKTRQELSYMGRPLDTRLSADVAREVCLRSGSKAFVDGAISGLGKQYVVLLHAVNCQTGEVVGTSEEEAESREKVLRVLGDAATKLRARLGESLATIQKYDTPVEATTASLDALKSYSLGVAARDVQGEHETIPLFKRAIELDPNFAMAYAKLGNTYINFNEPTRGAAAISKAYELRERVSEPEKLYPQ
ncbi:MAG: protein kinase [Terriglobales bacterium]